MEREGGDDEPLDLVNGAGDGILDLLGGGLGVVRGDLVGDLWDRCQCLQVLALLEKEGGRTVAEILAVGVRHVCWFSLGLMD